MPDTDRKLAAKLNNERVKLLAGTVNTVGLATVGAGLIVPGLGSPDAAFDSGRLYWAVVAVTLHLAAQAILRAMRSEG